MSPIWLPLPRQPSRNSSLGRPEVAGRRGPSFSGSQGNDGKDLAAPLVIVTASIVPAVPTHQAVANPHVRLEDYVRSISRWVESTDAEIVVVENTGSTDLLRARLDAWQKNWTKRLRLADARVPSHVVAQGKGASELFTVDAVLRAYDVPGDRCVVKASGRYSVSHPNLFLRSLDLAGLNLRMRRRGFADARLFAVPTWFMWDLAVRIGALDDYGGCYLEHLLADRAQSFSARGVPVQEPIIGSLVARAGSQGSIHGGRLGRISAYLRLAASLGRRYVR